MRGKLATRTAYSKTKTLCRTAKYGLIKLAWPLEKQWKQYQNKNELPFAECQNTSIKCNYWKCGKISKGNGVSQESKKTTAKMGKLVETIVVNNPEKNIKAFW